MESRVIQIGNMNVESDRNTTSYRIYSVKGVAPTLITAMGGGHTPLIIQQSDNKYR